MDRYITFEDQVVAAVATSTELPEFTGDVEVEGKVKKWGNVYAVHGYRSDGKKRPGSTIDDAVKDAVSKNDGIALVMFGRAGEMIEDSDDQAKVSYLFELYIDPIRFLRRDGGRNLTEIELAVIRFLNCLNVNPSDHCFHELKVKRWEEVGHPEMYATRITVEREWGL